MMGLTLYAGVVLISLMGSAIVGPMWTNGSGHPPLLEPVIIFTANKECHFMSTISPEIYRSARVFVTIYSMYDDHRHCDDDGDDGDDFVDGDDEDDDDDHDHDDDENDDDNDDDDDHDHDHVDEMMFMMMMMMRRRRMMVVIVEQRPGWTEHV